MRLPASAATRIRVLCVGVILLSGATAHASDLNLNGMWLMRSFKRVDPVEGIQHSADRGFFVMALRHDRRSGEVRGVRVRLPPGSMPQGYQPSPLVPSFVGRIDGDSIVRTSTAFALADPRQKCRSPPAYGFRIGKDGRELELLMISERDKDGFGCPVHTDPALIKARNPPNHSVTTYEPLYIVREVRFVEAAPSGADARALATVAAGQPFRVEVLFDLAPAFPIYATLAGRSGPVDIIVKATGRADVFRSDVIRINSRR